MKSKRSLGFILLGLLLWAGAAGLVAYNLYVQKLGGQATAKALEQLVPQIPQVVDHIDVGDQQEQVIPDYQLDPTREMPAVQVDGWPYIGTLEIPQLELVLPVIGQWGYPALRVSPCRYEGSAYQDNLIIMAHNYNTHFGRLPQLFAGSFIRFTDMDGNVFLYEVAETEEINGNTGKQIMKDGQWDLTLFTCTISGRTRFTVRCTRVDEPQSQGKFQP